MCADPHQYARSLLETAPGEEESKTAEAPQAPPVVVETTSETVEEISRKPVIFVSGCNKSLIAREVEDCYIVASCNTVYFLGPDGKPLHEVHESEAFEEFAPGTIHLPVLSSIYQERKFIEGGKILLAAKNIPNSRSAGQVSNIIDQLRKMPSLFIITDDMPDQARNAAGPVKCNGTFIIERLVNQEIMEDPSDFLKGLCQNAVTAPGDHCRQSLPVLLTR